MIESIIEIQNLVKDYNDTRAVDHLQLTIEKGEIFGLLGPNGAGKTTIILSLLGLTEPTSGQVFVKGFNATSEPIKVKKITGYLPDEVGFSENSTALESLIYTAMLNGIPRKKAEDSAHKWLKTVGLHEAKYQKTKTFSKGMIQRLGLADVLVKNPEIIVLDEPTIGIDPKGINEFLELIRTLSKENGITVLLSSHLLHQVQKICDRVGILVDGKLRAQGNISELAADLFGKSDTTFTLEVDPISDALIDDLSNIENVRVVSKNSHTIILKGEKESAPIISASVIQHGAHLYQLSYKEYGLDEIYQHYFEGRTINA